MDNKFNGILRFFQPWMKKDDDDYKERITSGIDSFAAPDKSDGATEIDRTDQPISGLQKAYTQSFYSSAPKLTNIKDLINQYRNLARYAEVDNAIDEIVDDAIVFEDNKAGVYLNLDDTSWNESLKDKVQKEFDEILRLLDFEREGRRIFRRWFVDSRIYMHKMIDPEKPKEGIKELRRIDPRFVDYVRENVKQTQGAGTYAYKGYYEYFVYNSTNDPRYQSLTSTQSQVQIPRSSMVYAHSGKVDVDGKSIIGYLHAAIKPANQLKMLEDAMVIYRITRAPERRVFYVDVGNMPPKKATQYVNSVMQGMKNRVVYDSTTGKVKTAANNLSMTEDYWLTRRDGKAVTEVTTLPGAAGMDAIEDVRWFNRKLYEALKIPLSRIPQDGGGITFGAGTEITRDELKFSKYIKTLRQDFESVFLDPLKTNLSLKNIVTEDEWEEVRAKIRVVFANDSYFEEMKDLEIMERRIGAIQAAELIIGKYISHDYIMREVLQMSDEEIKQQRKLIDEESKDSTYKNPEDPPEEF